MIRIFGFNRSFSNLHLIVYGKRMTLENVYMNSYKSFLVDFKGVE